MDRALEVTVPRETVNDESVRILSWEVISGSRVEKDRLICEVETSKAVMEMTSPEGGIVEYWAAVGEEIPVGSVIFRIVPEGQKPGPNIPIPIGSAASLDAPISQVSPARLTARAVAAADEYGVDCASFPMGTLVRRDDVVRRAAEIAGGVVPPATPVPNSGKESHNSRPRNAPVMGAPIDWVELPRRKHLEGRILRTGRAHCVQSSITSSFRARGLRARVDKLGFSSLGLSALIIFEVARLLRKYPAFNAVHDRRRIGHYRDVNIGWTIDTGKGLIVPVITHADRKSLPEIFSIMQLHLDAYLENTLAPSDLLGGTFTVSDLSGDGVNFFQPLISQGQSGILGIGRDLTDEFDELLYFTLAFDHQLGEGKTAAQFVRRLFERLEAHSSLESTSLDRSECEKQLFCILCQRDSHTLMELRAILVKSEFPAGLVCSICLKGY